MCAQDELYFVLGSSGASSKGPYTPRSEIRALNTVRCFLESAGRLHPTHAPVVYHLLENVNGRLRAIGRGCSAKEAAEQKQEKGHGRDNSDGCILVSQKWLRGNCGDAVEGEQGETGPPAWTDVGKVSQVKEESIREGVRGETVEEALMQWATERGARTALLPASEPRALIAECLQAPEFGSTLLPACGSRLALCCIFCRVLWDGKGHDGSKGAGARGGSNESAPEHDHHPSLRTGLPLGTPTLSQ